VRAVAPPDVAVVQSTAAWTAYGVPDAPYFVLVDGPGARIVGEGAAPAWDHVRNLMQNALADAGVVARSATPAHPRRARQTGRDRADRVNADLLAAGIGPDHPSLRPPARRVE
jgi:hypothetical protein